MSDESEKQVQLTAGEQLRHTREQKNLSVQDIASRLNLDTRIIEAIEDNNFELLPAATYARGYLRSYAKLLDIDAELILSAYNNEAPAPPEIIPEVKHSSQTSSSDKPVRAITYLISLSLVILLAAWLYSKFVIDADTTMKTDTIAEQSDVPVSALSYDIPVVEHSSQPFFRSIEVVEETGSTAIQSELGAENNTVPEPEESGDDDNEEYPLKITSEIDGPDLLVLRLTTDSWIEIYDSLDNRIFVNMGRQGQVLDLKGTAPFSVLLGYAEGVSVEINGKPFDSAPFTKGSIARFSLTP
ncbi:MAG: DUF4115 domain-containing protein [Gammaproteobacteria bacterium]|nr:DUF4115 domain-containing protein [Gammaproteobacteria bacterium]